MTVSLNFRLLSIAEKFEIETAKDGAVSRLASLAPSDPVGVLGPALAFHQTSLSRMALSALGNDYEWREERVPDGAYSWRYFNLPSGNPHLVSDIPLEWLERISSASWIQLVRMEEQVLTGCSTWENLASSFVSVASFSLISYRFLTSPFLFVFSRPNRRLSSGDSHIRTKSVSELDSVNSSPSDEGEERRDASRPS